MAFYTSMTKATCPGCSRSFATEEILEKHLKGCKTGKEKMKEIQEKRAAELEAKPT